MILPRCGDPGRESLIACGLCLTLYVIYSGDLLTTKTRPTALPTVAIAQTSSNKRVLVTGAAGFIGFHLARVLSRSQSSMVVAMDNFNDYYDVRLKMDRAYELHKLGIRFYFDDVCNPAYLEDMFATYNFTHVAHMAAQAGVRYSLQNPLAYVRANVQCQLALLDVLKKYPHIKLVYASSSSVYGKKSKIPFQLSAKTDNPGNMYAATKKTDELLGYHYCATYGISSVGLRFFTVYGPWGRPDMAVYKFAQSIMDGVDVPMFHISDDQPLARDFTYVDDVVAGIISALEYSPTECGERFNLGYGNPVSVPGLVDILQQELGVSTGVKKLPLPPTEILQTWADINTSTQFLHFKPKTDLKTGAHQFVQWYKSYRMQRAEEEASGLATPTDIWFERLLAEKEERTKLYEQDAGSKQSEQLLHRLQHEWQNYFAWARDLGKEVPSLRQDDFVFFPGVHSPGGDIVKFEGLDSNIEGLKACCLQTEQCIAFSSQGFLKSQIQPLSGWTDLPGQAHSTHGLYVARVNLCETNLHTCARHATCRTEALGQYTCSCKEGYYEIDQQCLPVYGTVDPLALRLDHMADYHSYYNVSAWKLGKKMIFVQGVDSPGGDYLVAEHYTGNHEKLIQACEEEPLCIAVTTHGLMKKRIQPRPMWNHYSAATDEGMYIYDVNYCLLADESCPEHATCQKVSPLDYRCQCEDDTFVLDSQKCSKKLPIRETRSQSKHIPQKTAKLQGVPGHHQKPRTEKRDDVLKRRLKKVQ